MHFVAIYSLLDYKISRFVYAPLSEVALQCQEDEELYLNCPPEATHIINNEPVTIIPEPVPLTETEIIAYLTRAIQAKLDFEARTHNYDGILSLCSYATSLDPVFKAEGQAGVEWRDACWRISYQVMAEVKAGTRPMPTSEELLAELPGMVWPV